MRIISKKRDYYDSIQAMGQDRTLVYVREEKHEKLENWPFPWINVFLPPAAKTPWTETFIVGFCGKLYPVLKWHDSHGGVEDVATFLNTIEDVDKYLEARIKPQYFEDYKAKSYHRHLTWPWNLNRLTFERFFEACAVGDYGKWFDKYRSPIFVATRRWGDGEIVYNGLLRPLEFMRVFDPFRAFQEISMWLGSLATPQKPIPEWDDATKIEAHGFDVKYSFRKEPSSKKRR